MYQIKTGSAFKTVMGKKSPRYYEFHIILRDYFFGTVTLYIRLMNDESDIAQMNINESDRAPILNFDELDSNKSFHIIYS